MPGTLVRIAGPAFIAAAATNIYTPPAATMYLVLRHIHIANDTALGATFSLFVGATGGSAAGTELYNGTNVPANSYLDWYGTLVMKATDFLTGICQTGASKLTITVEAEQYVTP